MERTPEEKLAAVHLIAEKIMLTAYRSILLEMRYIDVALGKLKPVLSMEVEYIGTNGETLFYNSIDVVKRYKDSPNNVNHDIIHLLLHCVFKHLFHKNIYFPYWDLACDITVQQLISTMNSPCIKVARPEMAKKLKEIEAIVDQFTPQNVMTYLQLKNLNEDEEEELSTLFHIDDHDLWLKEKGSSGKGTGEGDGSEQGDCSEGYTLLPTSIEKDWDNISRTVEMNMESFSKAQGNQAGNLQQKLKQINREPYDYSVFLKKFAQRHEVSKVNQDEFDYIFYTYGLNMYENMPLIEPLEYKDSHVIKDFVIAIDTSGSTSGEVVQKFLEKTYNILKSTESFAQTINLYIIQCDAQIQEVAHIKSQEELDDYIKNFVIKGLGGTDFRPVFGYIRKLMEEKALQSLKGMIYFTDGYGTFPHEKTPYDTAFVFIVPEDYENVTVPPWAMKVLLTEQEIKEFQADKNR